MSDFFEVEPRLGTPSVELLGYPCTETEMERVIALLSKLSNEEHTLHLEWVTYGIDGVMFSGDDLVVDFTARRRDGTNTDIEQASVVEAIDSRIAWFHLLDDAEELPILSYVEPIDEIGEGDVSNFEWEVIAGGKKDFAVHKMTEEAIRGLENWKKWVLGETKIRHVVGGNGTGVVDRMDRALFEFSPEQIEQRNNEFAETLTRLSQILAPAISQTKKLVESVGEDWDELVSGVSKY